jgi:hypothetical protein
MSDINPEKVWKLTQQEISDTTYFSQSYVHYILNCDRKPSVESAEKLEIATGVCREAWLFPERHHNPYIPFYHGNNCLRCVNRKDRTKWMVERMTKLTCMAEPGNRLRAFFRVVHEARIGLGFPDSLRFSVFTLRPEGFLLLFEAGKQTFPAPYLIPYWILPWMSEEITTRKTIEIKDLNDERLIKSPMDAKWIAETKCQSLLAVSSIRLMLVTSACCEGPAFEWTDEAVMAMNGVVNELDGLFGDELDDPLNKL